MGKSDIIARQYIEDNAVFADVFNFILYDGRTILEPSQLHPMDTAFATSLSKNNSEMFLQKFRDTYKAYTAKTDGKAAYLLLGIEEQSEISYTMPVRAMLYDALSYDQQIQRIARAHQEKKDYHKRSPGEYLSGFYKEDRLVPVITAVLLLSPDTWDGPTQLHDMLDIKDPSLLSMIENYKVHLIAPSALTKEKMSKFKTNLREVLSFIKYSKDKDQVRTLVESNPRFAAMDPNAAMVIRTCTHYDFPIEPERKGGNINMGNALQDIFDEGKEHGFAQGQIALVQNLMESLQLTANKAMEMLKIPEAVQEKYLVMLEESSGQAKQ